MQSSQLASWENPWQNLTVIFWNIIKLSVFLFRNTCSTDLAHILVQELSRFCFRELNPIREINADNKSLLLTMAHREIFGKKRQLSQFDGSFNEHGFYVLTNTNTYMNLCIYCQNTKISHCTEITKTLKCMWFQNIISQPCTLNKQWGFYLFP